ncbi:MAG: hypothetical protein M9899_00350 [Bdellovibrionaceae bacterium]|nr:hypothetical protein [Pseudobdellovibrionaceae bacterium]
MSILKSYLLPGLPHILLQPQVKTPWTALHQAFDKVRTEIEELNPDLILIYSSYWSSIIGHQILAKENIKWTLVDDEWHELGSIPYTMNCDVEFAREFKRTSEARGLLSKLTDYEGFPVDTGTVTVNQLVNPKNKFKVCVTSSNIYSDRSETQILGKAAHDAIENLNRRTVVIVISSLSNRYNIEPVNYDSQEDRISSAKDHEWNLKFLEFLSQGRLEDASQLSRQFHREARVTKKVVNFKPFWWWSAVAGMDNNYTGEVFEYQPVHGTGAAVVGMTRGTSSFGDLEFDEDNTDFYMGNRNVLSTGGMDSGKLNITDPFTSSHEPDDEEN